MILDATNTSDGMIQYKTTVEMKSTAAIIATNT